MLDFLLPFHFLTTVFSVVGTEISQKLASIGGVWFNILYVWILYAVYDDWDDNDLLFNQIGSYLVWSFVMSTAYVTIRELLSLVSFINLPSCWFMNNVTSFLMKLTFPYILWRYVYLPTEMLCSMAIAYGFGSCFGGYCTFASGFLAFVITGVVVSYVCQSPGMVHAGRTRRRTTSPRKTPVPVAKRTRSATVQKGRQATSRRR